MAICRDVLKYLVGYLEQRLDPVLVAGVWVHLNRCEHCRLVVESARKTMADYYLAGASPAPASVRAVGAGASSPAAIKVRRIA